MHCWVPGETQLQLRFQYWKALQCLHTISKRIPALTSSHVSPLRSLPVRLSVLFVYFFFPNTLLEPRRSNKYARSQQFFINSSSSPSSRSPPSPHECSSESHPNRLTTISPATTYMPSADEPSANQRPVFIVFASKQRVPLKRTLQTKQAGGCMPA